MQNLADLCKPAIQLSRGIILLLDHDGSIVSCNEFLESSSGYASSELIRQNCFDLLLADEDREPAKRLFQSFLQKGKARKKIVTRIITKSGRERHIEWHTRRLEDEASTDGIGMLAVGQDVSKRVKRERQLLDQRNELIERNKELTCLYKMTKIVGRNKPLPQMLEDIARIIPPAFQYPAATTTVIRLDTQAYGAWEKEATGPSLTEELVIQKIPRGHIEIISSVPQTGPKKDQKPFLHEERALLRSLAHHLSLAIEKKEAIDTQAEMEQQLRHSDRLAKIGQLTAGVAHELNEPLGNILGFAQLSSKNCDLPEQVSRDLGNIVKAALHAREIIKKLMFFSRQTPPRETLVNLNQLIEDGLYLFESRCAKSGIEITKSFSPDLPAIKADVSQLQQVLTNLIVNALQAMPEGGTLKIETSFDEDRVLFGVQDSGIGMDQETVKQIFLPFFSTKDISEGTGLGLSVVHGIVKSHGGSIAVKSQPGQGSRFEIRFPLAPLV